MIFLITVVIPTVYAIICQNSAERPGISQAEFPDAAFPQDGPEREIMSDLLFSFHTVLPVLLLATLGYFLRRLGMFTPGFLGTAAKFLYAICFPFTIFSSLAGAELQVIFSSSPFCFSAPSESWSPWF
jgi:hypothetical protein